jgi:hypothetical protein
MSSQSGVMLLGKYLMASWQEGKQSRRCLILLKITAQASWRTDMAKSRFIEFFEGANNRLSMSRLLAFLSIFPATFVLIYKHDAETLAYYLGAFVSGYIGGKFADRPQRNIERDTQ